MARFDRKSLREIFADAEVEVPKDILTKLCTLHQDAVDESAESITDLKAKLEKAEHERDAFKAKVPEEGKEFVEKTKFDELKTQYDNYKAEIAGKETRKAQESAIREMLKADKKFPEGILDLLMKASDGIITSVKFDKDGKIENDADIKGMIDKSFGQYRTETEQGGTHTPNPNNGGNAGGTTSLAGALHEKFKS